MWDLRVKKGIKDDFKILVWNDSGLSFLYLFLRQCLTLAHAVLEFTYVAQAS